MAVPKKVRRTSALPVELRKALARVDMLAVRLTKMTPELKKCGCVIRNQAATIQSLAETDALTTLANRRHLFEFAEAEMDSAVCLDLPLSVLIIDLDHFKSTINDKYGHPMGDRCLRAAGRICVSQIRDGVDLAARYGGEELAIVLPGLDKNQAASVGERIRRKFAAYRFRDSDCRMTVTIGVAGRGQTTKFDDVLAAADAALFAGKRAGRNRVEVAFPTCWALSISNDIAA